MTGRGPRQIWGTSPGWGSPHQPEESKRSHCGSFRTLGTGGEGTPLSWVPSCPPGLCYEEGVFHADTKPPSPVGSTAGCTSSRSPGERDLSAWQPPCAWCALPCVHSLGLCFPPDSSPTASSSWLPTTGCSGRYPAIISLSNPHNPHRHFIITPTFQVGKLRQG